MNKPIRSWKLRKPFGKILISLADVDDKIVLLIGDNGYGIFDEFVRKYPDRFFNLGLREQSMVGVAAGMALSGLKPYVYTITPFLVERAFEQVKLDIDQQNVNVKLVGYADYPDQGPTHTEVLTKDICDKIFVNIRTFAPKTEGEVVDAVMLSYTQKFPTFISLKRLK